MPTLADSIVSSSSRRLAIRARPDLTARKQRYQGRSYWVVKDPVGLQYFRFEEEEYAILQMLDGEASLEQIAEQFEREFPPQTIRVEELQNFIGMLHKSGLVLSDAIGQGSQLKERRDEKKRRELLAALSNVLAFRFRGFDPERLLNFLYPYVRWFFTPTATFLAMILCLCALTLVIVQFDIFQSRLPGFHSFFAAKNWLALAGTLMATKVLHEFGHGMSCKHFGGECHEMGVMMLVLTPCLYCNVSDSWMLPNRWHRAAIGAAGMYVEVVLASICTFLWWFSEPGWLNYVCLNVMFVSSVSTILFNANPLLRYDGYYILSDILEIPNLRQKANSILTRKLGKWCLGLEEPEDPFLPKRNQAMFALFTVASFVYRWVVLLSILFFLNKVFEPYGLKVLGQMIAIASLWGLVFMPVKQLYTFFKVPGRWSKVKRLRLAASALVVVGLIAGVLFIPFPSSVSCLFELQPHRASSVYIEVPGRLVSQPVQPGQRVEKGDVLAELENLELEMQICRLQGDLESQRVELESLATLRSHDARYALEVRVAERELAAIEEQLEQKRRDAERLRITAPASGVVIPPPRMRDRENDNAVELVSWSGTPLDVENVGATLTPDGQQNLFCQIGDPTEWEAVLVIDQDDIDLVQDGGQEVELMFDEWTYKTYVSVIEAPSEDPMEAVSPRLASTSGGPLPAEASEDGVIRPLNNSYQAVSRLTDDEGMFRNGLIGQARITTRPRTLGARLYRYLTRTFNFRI
ncbi:MAG: biotin/lipoyl-binding protein [Planctomycetales bacterium]|nr:biotin/lipoyl-binding protein [Planctomycetales bacterium]